MMNAFLQPNIIDLWSSFFSHPKTFFSFTSSTLIAAAMGVAYALVGRAIYPKQNISPLNYSLWFAIAFQIKQSIRFVEDRYDSFLGDEGSLDQLKSISKKDLCLKDRLRFNFWKLIEIKD